MNKKMGCGGLHAGVPMRGVVNILGIDDPELESKDI